MIRRRLLRYYLRRQQNNRFIKLLNTSPNSRALYYTGTINDNSIQEQNNNETTSIPTKRIIYNSTNINEKNEELAKWIRNSSIETPVTSLGNDTDRFPKTYPENIYTNTLNLTSNGAGYIGGVPAVDDDTFNIIWKNKFITGDPHTVDIVLKRIKNRRTIFNINQLIVLLKALQYLKREAEIHKIYCGYSKYLRYFLMDNLTYSQNSEKEVLLELFMESENELKNFANCESLFSHYIKYSRIKSHITLIGLKSFVENNNLQLAKEFFIQIMTNQETFPLTKCDFYAFLLYLDKSMNYKSMDYFYQLWTYYEHDTSNFDDSKFSITSLMHRIYLLSGNETKILQFIDSPPVKEIGYSNSLRYELTKFYFDLFQSSKIKGNKLTTIEITEEIRKKIRNFHIQLSDNVDERRLFYLTLVKAFKKLNNMKEMKTVVNMVDQDSDITLDNEFHELIVEYFVKNSEMRNCLDYYKELIKIKAPINEKKMFFSIFRCFESEYPNMVNEYKNEMKLIFTKKSDFDLYFPWIQNCNRYWTKKNGLGFLDYRTFMRFQKSLKKNYIIEAREVLISRYRDGIVPKFQMFYLMLNLCLRDGFINLAATIDNIIKETYNNDINMSAKVQLLWLKHSLKISDINQASKRERILKFEKHYESKFLSFQNLVQLSDIFNGIYDFENSHRTLLQAFQKIEENDKTQWIMYYTTLLKIYGRQLEIDKFVETLREWNSNSKASLIKVDTLKTLRGFTKYFIAGLQTEEGINEIYKSQGDAYIKERMMDIDKELQILGDRYGSNKIKGLIETHNISQFLQKSMLDKYKSLQETYEIRRKELIAKTNEPE